MKLISHRGNIDGPLESYENEPNYIDLAIKKGYDVEVDVWVKDGTLFLGHDEPQYGVTSLWIRDRLDNLWLHCKNVEAMVYFQNFGGDAHYFWHENDAMTLTSRNYIWAFPNKQPIPKSIAVMPELNDDDISQALGICSDYIEKYKL